MFLLSAFSLLSPFHLYICSFFLHYRGLLTQPSRSRYTGISPRCLASWPALRSWGRVEIPKSFLRTGSKIDQTSVVARWQELECQARKQHSCFRKGKREQEWSLIHPSMCGPEQLVEVAAMAMADAGNVGEENWGSTWARTGSKRLPIEGTMPTMKESDF